MRTHHHITVRIPAALYAVWRAIGKAGRKEIYRMVIAVLSRVEQSQ